MTLCLALSTAGRGIGVVIASRATVDGPITVLAEAARDGAHGQAEHLPPMIEAVLIQAGVALAAVDVIAVTVGPGSFTGIRVGIAAARGLGFALDRPVVGVTSFEAVVEAVSRGNGDEPGDHAILALIDSKRADVFAQAFHADGRPMGPPVAVAADAVADLAPSEPFILAGDAAGAFGPTRHVISPATATAADVARVGLAHWARGAAPVALPLYLRAPDTTPPGPRSAAAAVFGAGP